MNTNEIKIKLLKDIVENEWEKVFELLNSLTLDKSLKYYDLPMIQGHYNDYNKRYKFNTLSEDDFMREKSKTRDQLLDFVQRIPDTEYNLQSPSAKDAEVIKSMEKTITDLFEIINDTQERAKIEIEKVLLEKHYIISFDIQISHLHCFVLINIKEFVYVLQNDTKLISLLDELNLDLNEFKNSLNYYLDASTIMSSNLKNNFRDIKDLNVQKQIISFVKNKIDKHNNNKYSKFNKNYETQTDVYNIRIFKLHDDIKFFYEIMENLDKKIDNIIKKQRKIDDKAE